MNIQLGQVSLTTDSEVYVREAVKFAAVSWVSTHFQVHVGLRSQKLQIEYEWNKRDFHYVQPIHLQ